MMNFLLPTDFADAADYCAIVCHSESSEESFYLPQMSQMITEDCIAVSHAK